MMGRLKRAAPLVAWCVLLLTVSTAAADLRISSARAEGRKRSAESGAKFIRSRGADVNQASVAYAAAATAHNEWLSAATTAIEQGAMSEGVSDAAGKAAAAFVQWIRAKNGAVGEPVISGAEAEKTEAATRQDLIDIASETIAKGNGDAKRRSDASALASRLRWKTWSDL